MLTPQHRSRPPLPPGASCASCALFTRPTRTVRRVAGELRELVTGWCARHHLRSSSGGLCEAWTPREPKP